MQNGHSNPTCDALTVFQEMSAVDKSKSHILGEREFSFDLGTDAIVLLEWLNSFDKSQQQQQQVQQRRRQQQQQQQQQQQPPQPQCLRPQCVVGDERIFLQNRETTADSGASSFSREGVELLKTTTCKDLSVSGVESLNHGRVDELFVAQKTQPMPIPLSFENSPTPATATAAAAAAAMDVNATGVAVNRIVRDVHSSDVENSSDWLERKREMLNIKRSRATDKVKNPKLIEELKAIQKIMSRRRTDASQRAVYSDGQVTTSSDFDLRSGKAKQCAILDGDQNTSFRKQNQFKSDETYEGIIDNNTTSSQRSIIDDAIRSMISAYSRNDEITNCAPFTKMEEISSGRRDRYPRDLVCRNIEFRLNSTDCDSEVFSISPKSTEGPDSENSPATAVTTTSSNESSSFLPVFSPVSPVVPETVKEKRLEANHLLRLDDHPPEEHPFKTPRITRTPSLEMQLKELEIIRELIERQQKHLTENQSSITEIQKTIRFGDRRSRRPSTDFDRPTTNGPRSHSETRTHGCLDVRQRPTGDVYSPQTPDDDSGSVRRPKCEGGVSNQFLGSHVLPFQATSVSGMKPTHESIPKEGKGQREEDHACSDARDLKSNERRRCRDVEANCYAGQEKRRLEKSVDLIEGKICDSYGARRADESAELSLRTTSVGSEDDETKRLEEEASGDQPWEDGSSTSDGQQQQLALDRLMQQRATTTQSPYADIDNGHAQSQHQQQRFGHSSSCASSSSVTEQSSPGSSVSSTSSGKGGEAEISSSLQFIKSMNDSNKQWYRPNMTREDVINFLKDKAEGSFVIRDSRTFAGHFALALKVSETPRNTATSNGQTSTAGESHQMNENLIRHFLIESKPNGVQLKERNNEPLFPSLTAFVYQHCLVPLSLPHKLILSSQFSDEMSFESDIVLRRSSSNCKDPETISTTFAYIGSMDLELLTGQEALEKAIAYLEYGSSPQTLVHFALSTEGILLTDTNRRVFFRRHFPLSSVSYCGRCSEEKRIFGFVSRMRSVEGNECHLFADYETGFSADNVLDLIKRHIQSRNRKELSNFC